MQASHDHQCLLQDALTKATVPELLMGEAVNDVSEPRSPRAGVSVAAFAGAALCCMYLRLHVTGIQGMHALHLLNLEDLVPTWKLQPRQLCSYIASANALLRIIVYHMVFTRALLHPPRMPRAHMLPVLASHTLRTSSKHRPARRLTTNAMPSMQNSRRTTVSHINSEEEAELSGERAAPPKGDDGELYDDGEDNLLELEELEEQQEQHGTGADSGHSWRQEAGREQSAGIR